MASANTFAMDNISVLYDACALQVTMVAGAEAVPTIQKAPIEGEHITSEIHSSLITRSDKNTRIILMLYCSIKLLYELRFSDLKNLLFWVKALISFLLPNFIVIHVVVRVNFAHHFLGTSTSKTDC